MKLLAFAASNSKKPINGQLLNYAISLMEDIDTRVLDINDCDMPHSVKMSYTPVLRRSP